MEGPESFIIEIEREKVEGLLNEFDGDLSWLAQHLKLMNKRMVLINPVSGSLNLYLLIYDRCYAEIPVKLARRLAARHRQRA